MNSFEPSFLCRRVNSASPQARGRHADLRALIEVYRRRAIAVIEYVEDPGVADLGQPRPRDGSIYGRRVAKPFNQEAID